MNLPDALAVVLAEMRASPELIYPGTFSASQYRLKNWADRIEQALAAQRGEAVAWLVVRTADGEVLDILTDFTVAEFYRNAGTYERQACKVVPAYTHPSPPLGAGEVEWLEYAVDHMNDDSEPEDKTCAEVLGNLLRRYTGAGKAVWTEAQVAVVHQEAAKMLAKMKPLKLAQDDASAGKAIEGIDVASIGPLSVAAALTASIQDPTPVAVQVDDAMVERAAFAMAKNAADKSGACPDTNYGINRSYYLEEARVALTAALAHKGNGE